MVKCTGVSSREELRACVSPEYLTHDTWRPSASCFKSIEKIKTERPGLTRRSAQAGLRGTLPHCGCRLAGTHVHHQICVCDVQPLQCLGGGGLKRRGKLLSQNRAANKMLYLYEVLSMKAGPRNRKRIFAELLAPKGYLEVHEINPAISPAWPVSSVPRSRPSA